MFAAVVLAAIDQIARAGAQRIVGLAERRDAAVLVVVHADIEPDFRHPLGMAHRAGPGSAHFLRRAPAAVDDLQGVDQFGFPIGAAARLVPGERCERRKHRTHMVLLHQGIAIGGLDAPQRQQRAALDAKILFDPRKQRLVLPERFLARDDAPVRGAAIDVLPDLLVELRLLLHLPEHGHVGLDAAHHPGPGRIRNALGQGARAKAVAPGVEAGRRQGERRLRRGEQGGCADTGLQHGAAGRRLKRIEPGHGRILGGRAFSPKLISGRAASGKIVPSSLKIQRDPGEPAPDRGLASWRTARPPAAVPRP